VKDANRPPLRIHHNHGKTIRGLDCQQKARRRGHNSIAHQSLLRDSIHTVNHVRVNLPQRNDRPRSLSTDAQLLEECRPIPFDGGTGILLREPKVQCLTAVCTRETASASREAMNQPGQLLKPINLENFNFGFNRDKGRHEFILPNCTEGIFERHRAFAFSAKNEWRSTLHCAKRHPFMS